MSFPYRNIGFWTARRASLTPARIALRAGGRDYTYAELEDRAARAAGALEAAGVSAGERVAAYLPNGIAYVDVFLACARLGAILVPLSTRLAAPELEFIANDSGSATLVCDATLADVVAEFLPGTSIKSVLVAGGPGDDAFEAACAAARPAGVRDVAPDDVLAIVYTSGTTGRPKGAMLTHANFFWTNLNIGIALDFTNDERTVVALPMFHIGGWNVNTLAVWLKGGTVFLEESFDAGRLLALIAEHRITSFMGVPTMYALMAEHASFQTSDISSVREFVCGGAPLPVPLIRRYQQRGARFIQGYGLTEAAPNCLALPPEDAVRKAGTAGRPYFFTDVRVVDDRDHDVPAGGSGEIVVRGPSVMKGYWNLPEETAAALRDGWLRTGDVGRVDDEGYITIVDRVKDMYISGGENVYPAEVEHALAAHPSIAEAAVVGVPDARWGEAGLAIVVLRPGATATPEDVRAFCLEHLAKFKVPRDVVFTASLPRNATGKLLKTELRDRFGGAS
ncbi:MAG: acyl-CoA synthetase [Actinomycetota bacterium]